MLTYMPWMLTLPWENPALEHILLHTRETGGVLMGALGCGTCQLYQALTSPLVSAALLTCHKLPVSQEPSSAADAQPKASLALPLLHPTRRPWGCRSDGS